MSFAPRRVDNLAALVARIATIRSSIKRPLGRSMTQDKLLRGQLQASPCSQRDIGQWFAILALMLRRLRRSCLEA